MEHGQPRCAFVVLLCCAFFLVASSGVALAQPTAFKYQGELTDSGNPATGSYLFRFRLFDAAAGGVQIGATLNDIGASVSEGIFTVALDFGGDAFVGAARYLEISVRRNTGESYVTLSPREQITSSPYAIRTLRATYADEADLALDSAKLGGVAASEYVTDSDTRLVDARTPLPGSDHYIRNSIAGQAGDFHIGGSGLIAGKLGLGSATVPDAKFAVYSETANSASNTADFTALNIGPNASHIHWGTMGDWYVRSASSGGKVILQDTGGNVGIGTLTPTSARLVVNGATASAIRGDSSSAAGVVGVSSSNSGVSGSSASGAGLFGTSANFHGVFGRSTVNVNAAGVFGDHTAGGIGVQGVSSSGRALFAETSTGTAVYARSTGTGTALYAEGRAWQPVGNTGFVKAAVFVAGSSPGAIIHCQNPQLGVFTGECGMQLIRSSMGSYVVFPGFSVVGRYFSVTPGLNSASAVTATAKPNVVGDGVEVRTFSPTGSAIDANFYVLIY